MEEKYCYRFVPKCNHAQGSHIHHVDQYFRFYRHVYKNKVVWDPKILLPWQRDVTTYHLHRGFLSLSFLQGGAKSKNTNSSASHRKSVETPIRKFAWRSKSKINKVNNHFRYNCYKSEKFLLCTSHSKTAHAPHPPPPPGQTPGHFTFTFGQMAPVC